MPTMRAGFGCPVHQACPGRRLPCHTGFVTATPSLDGALARTAKTLRENGALFAYVHGSRARGTARADSDIDVAAYFGRRGERSWDMLLPDAVDLLVLDDAPLELAGRVALEGTVLFEADVNERIRWEATTRKIFLDERPRTERSHREFLEGLRCGR